MTGETVGSNASLRDIAEAGLQQRIRPFLSHRPTVAPELFHLDELISVRERALELLQASFQAMCPEDLSRSDRDFYAQEMSRRRQMLEELTLRREGLLETYGRELSDSPINHLDLILPDAS